MSENAKNRELFGAIRDHLNKADLSNAEQFDKAILTLSTGGLGFSIALIKFVIPLQAAINTILLRLSWICFVFAIVLTVISFMTARAAIRDTRMYALKYYMEMDDDYGDKVSPYSRATYWLNIFSGSIFVLAVILTITFVSFNANWEASVQDQDNNTNIPTEERGYVPPPASSGGKPKKPEENKPEENDSDNGKSGD